MNFKAVRKLLFFFFKLKTNPKLLSMQINLPLILRD